MAPWLEERQALSMRHDVTINVIYPPDEAGMDPTKPPDGAGAVDEQ